MDEQQRQRYCAAAERGDLRPQFNPLAAAALSRLDNLQEMQPILLDRFSQLRRPIADASRGVEPAMRLSDIGSFLYLIETLRRLQYPNLEEMLGILLDEFSPYEERSYDELSLWCIVQLSRTHDKYVRRFWPEVFRLDVNFRNADWRPNPDCHLIDQPYRLTDLVLYYYEIYTRGIYIQVVGQPWNNRKAFPSVGNWLEVLWPELAPEQREIARRAAQAMRIASPNHSIYSGDTLALLAKRDRQGQEER